MQQAQSRVRRTRLLGWALAQCLLAPLGLGLAVFAWAAGVLSLLWLGIPLLLGLLVVSRGFAALHRRWAGRVLGADIPSPYRPRPRGWRAGATTSLRDPATWRDFAWLFANGTAGLVLCVLPLALLIVGLGTVGLSAAWPLLPAGAHAAGPVWLADQAGAFFAIPPRVACVSGGFAILLLGWLFTPPLILGNARIARWLLAPTERARLARRVEALASSRADTVDAHAAELRRLERDLHDGAQARLVSLGMSLGLAEEIAESDPQEVKALLAEARQSSSLALSELRDLVRGIHPPVLADRGVAGAVQALALDCPVPTEVTADLAGRLPAPVESAAYFAVAETLANVVKHSRAREAEVHLGYADGTLSILVIDDGAGGADPVHGTGLRGIERRLAAFDGTLSVTSPPGGPTQVRMRLPCALSSPKTSPSSATA
jgi:signal transduction histidine kinase